MTVLLTGGAGYIGSHTCVALLEAGYRVVIADNFSNSSPEAVRRIGQITGKQPMLYELDVCDSAALSSLFAQEPIDTVVHFAGLKAVGESVAKPLYYYQNNFGAAMTLLAVMEQYGVKRLIFSSSATVYGVPKALPYTEEMPTGPCTNPYGWTKLMIEQLLIDHAAANPDFSAVLLRYFNPVGAHPSGMIGEDPRGIPNNLMPYITQVAVGRRPFLSVFGNDYPTKDGTGVRDYIHVMDLAHGHLAAIPYAAAHPGAIPINLGTGRGYSVLEMAETFSRVNGVEIPCRFAPRRPGDLPEYYADPTRAKKLLGWQAEYGLEEICRDAWNWQKNNPNGYLTAE